MIFLGLKLVSRLLSSTYTKI